MAQKLNKSKFIEFIKKFGYKSLKAFEKDLGFKIDFTKDLLVSELRAMYFTLRNQFVLVYYSCPISQVKNLLDEAPHVSLDTIANALGYTLWE